MSFAHGRALRFLGSLGRLRVTRGESSEGPAAARSDRGAAARTGIPRREDKTQVNQSVKQRSIPSKGEGLDSVTD